MAKNAWTSSAFIQSASPHSAWNPHFSALGSSLAYNARPPRISYNANMSSRGAFAAAQPLARAARPAIPPRAAFGAAARSPVHSGTAGARSTASSFMAASVARPSMPSYHPQPETMAEIMRRRPHTPLIPRGLD